MPQKGEWHDEGTSVYLGMTDEGTLIRRDGMIETGGQGVVVDRLGMSGGEKRIVGKRGLCFIPILFFTFLLFFFIWAQF